MDGLYNETQKGFVFSQASILIDAGKSDQGSQTSFRQSLIVPLPLRSKRDLRLGKGDTLEILPCESE